MVSSDGVVPSLAELLALRGLALGRRTATVPGFFGVCVAVINPETGAPLAEAADVVLDSPDVVPGFLAMLVTELESIRSR